MASFEKSFVYGNQLISIPLDLSGGTEGDDPRDLFLPYLRNDSDTDYLYKNIISGGEGLFNINGTWSGNLLAISKYTAYWVLTTQAHTKTFNGNVLTTDMNYTLGYGNNFVSYPHTDTHDLGSGSYATGGTPTEGYIINPDLLKGSGHANASITSITHEGTAKFYDGSGSDLSDWSGNLTNFEPGKGYVLYVESVDFATITDNLWMATPTQDYIPSTATTADSDGNRAFFAHKGVNDASSQFCMVLFESPSKILKANGDTLIECTGGSGLMGASTSDGQLAFFNYDKLFYDADRPLWNCCGAVWGTSDDSYFWSSFDTGVNSSSFTVTEATSGTVSDQCMYDSSAGLRAWKNNPANCKFSAQEGKNILYQWAATSVSITQMGVGGYLNDLYRFQSFHSEISPYNTAFGDAHRIAPIIYDPSYSSGQRFRYTKYYPHLADNASGDGLYSNRPEFYDVFYNEDGSTKWSSELGEPFIEPHEKILPYPFPLTGYEYFSPKFIVLRGVLQIL